MSKLEWLNLCSENISIGSGPGLIGEVVKMCAEISAVVGFDSRGLEDLYVVVKDISCSKSLIDDNESPCLSSFITGILNSCSKLIN